MDFNEFIEELVLAIENKIDKNTHITVNRVVKNNGIHLSGLCFKNDNLSAAPTVYVDYYYEKYIEGMSIEDIADELINVYEHNRLTNDFNMDFFANYEEVKDSLFCKLINFARNEEILSYTPYRKYLDLAIVVYCKVNNAQIGMASVLIRNNHLNMWEKEADEVIDRALENTKKNMKYKVSHILDALDDLNVKESGIDEDDLNAPMYVITNEEKIFGAIYMVYKDVLKDIYNMIGGDYLVLPSSVHEFIVIRLEEECDMEKINSMICEINDTSLREEEVLSDHAYRYSDNEEVLIF